MLFKSFDNVLSYIYGIIALFNTLSFKNNSKNIKFKSNLISFILKWAYFEFLRT